MTEKKDKFVEAVTKLIKLTQEGELQWRSGDISRYDIKVESVFITEYKDRLMRLYKYVYKVQQPGPFTLTHGIFGSKREYPYWETSVKLEFIDSNGRTVWEFPSTPALFDLLEEVQYQVAEVDEFLDDIMAEK